MEKTNLRQKKIEEIVRRIRKKEVIEAKIWSNWYSCPLNKENRNWCKYELDKDGNYIVSYYHGSEIPCCEKRKIFTNCHFGFLENENCPYNKKNKISLEIFKKIISALIGNPWVDIVITYKNGTKAYWFGGIRIDKDACELCKDKENCLSWID